ncbi:hypothetical protein DV738_g2000, partial [Chaetothyriales sp. CBS 135597]
MYHDDEQYNKSRFLALAWIGRLREALPSLVRDVGSKLGVEVEYEFLALGSYNCCYRLKGLHSILRFPILCKSAFRYEKTTDECMVMAYISRHTAIPTPKLLAAESCEFGPYTVLSFVDGTRLSDCLKAAAASNPDTPTVLRPDIDTALLSRAYSKMATILLELSRCQFDRIGAVGQDASGTWCVTKRPVTLNMNQLVSCGNYPPKSLPQHAFTTANEYFTALAEVHITHLQTQRNDAVEDEADCRKKYVARHLFLRIARGFSTEYNHGPFPLYCDDLRPGNVIVDSSSSADLDVRGVIDWEYCYAAPAELTYCPPAWLLLTHPDDWPEGDLGTFLEQYLPRYRLFLESLRLEEDKMIERDRISESQRLSTKMARSLENGHFWVCLAATSSFGFDDIYWKFIDPLYYGDFTSLEDRIRLLSVEEQDKLQGFVELKMRQANDGGLDEHLDLHDRFAA